MNSVLTVRVMFYACLDIIYLKRECGTVHDHVQHKEIGHNRYHIDPRNLDLNLLTPKTSILKTEHKIIIINTNKCIHCSQT